MSGWFAMMVATALASTEASPPACVASSLDAGSASEAFVALADAKLAPLCAEAAKTDEDFRLRRTITYLPDHKWILDIRARRGGVHVRVVDTLFQPSESQSFMSRLSPSRLLANLDEEGWSQVWTADDPPCATPGPGMQIGTVWEFRDASGYRARIGPRPQFCETPYKAVIHDISEFLDEVLLLTRRR